MPKDSVRLGVRPPMRLRVAGRPGEFPARKSASPPRPINDNSKSIAAKELARLGREPFGLFASRRPDGLLLERAARRDRYLGYDHAQLEPDRGGAGDPDVTQFGQ